MDEFEKRDYDNREFRSLFLDNLKYSARRYDVVCLVFTGFGIYANYELFKAAGNLNVGTWSLLVSTLLLLIIAFTNLYVLRCDSILQGKWIGVYQNINTKSQVQINQKMKKAEEFESKLELKRGLIYFGLIVTTVLTLVGFVLLNLV
jgi:Ca2+/Na+ antiporter